MSILPSRLRALVAALPLTASLGGCFSWSRQPAASPEPDHFLFPRGFARGPVRVTRTDGPPIVLFDVRIGRDSLVGNERARPYGRVAIPVSDVRRVETRRVDPLATVAVTVVSALAAVAAVSVLLVHSECTCLPPN